MESLQLFTAVLMAVCVIHLVFSTVATLDRWLAGHRHAAGAAPKGSAKVSSSSWYVFFDPADLYGRPVPSRKKYSGKNSQVPRRGGSRRMTVRPAA